MRSIESFMPHVDARELVAAEPSQDEGEVSNLPTLAPKVQSIDSVEKPVVVSKTPRVSSVKPLESKMSRLRVSSKATKRKRSPSRSRRVKAKLTATAAPTQYDFHIEEIGPTQAPRKRAPRK